MSRAAVDLAPAPAADAMGPRRHQARRAAAIALAFTVLYLVLDRLSFIRPLYGISITAWNPPPGLGLALLITGGLGWTPIVAAAAFLSDLTLLPSTVPRAAILASDLVVAGGYAAAAAILRHPIEIEPGLYRSRDVVALIGTAVIAPVLVALGFVTPYAIASIIPWGEVAQSAYQYWIGDAIGITVFAPPLLLLSRHRDYWARSWRHIDHWRLLEAAAQLLGVAAALAVVFGFSNHRHSFELFYVLFLPLVWIATRHGLGGACLAVLAIQVGIISGLELQDRSAATIRTFQILMLALAVTGLMLGATVSERRRVARALARNESRLGAILNTVTDGMLVIDSQGLIESVNPAVERIFARPPGHLVGRNVGELFDTLDLPDDVFRIADPRGGISVYRELKARRGDGGSVPVEVTAGRFGTPDDRRYALVVRDITLRRDAEARAREHQAELAHMGRLSVAGEMASALAHELNQPLAAIAAYGRGCRRLLTLPSPDPVLLREGIVEVVRQAERAGDIISRLREFMRPGTSCRAAVAVRTLIESAVALAAMEATQHKISIELRIDRALPPVLADSIQIEQVLLNLLRNAMEAMAGSSSERRVITVEAARISADAVQLTVADTGPGVSEDAAARLFEPFVTTKPNGMGLGLSISRSIIEAHDGRLRLASGSCGPGVCGSGGGGTEGRGAAFAFDLPVARQGVPRDGG